MENDSGAINQGPTGLLTRDAHHENPNGVGNSGKAQSRRKPSKNTKTVKQSQVVVARRNSASVVRTSPAYVLDENGVASKAKKSVETLQNFASDQDLNGAQRSALDVVNSGVDDLVNIYIREVSGKVKEKAELTRVQKALATAKPPGHVPAQRTIPPWVPDYEQTECFACKSGFSLLNRKHHCRKCGNIFHDKCTPFSMPIRKYGYRDPVRVCKACRDLLVGPSNGSTSTNIPTNPFRPAGILAEIKKPHTLRKVETPKQKPRSQDEVLKELKSSLKKRASTRKSRFQTPKQHDEDDQALHSPVRNLDHELEKARSGKKLESDRKIIESLVPKSGPIANLFTNQQGPAPSLSASNNHAVEASSPSSSWN